MPAEARSIPAEILYHFVTKFQSVDQLFNTLYDRPSELTKQHFRAINSHLDQNVRPGQMVIITPPNAQQCTVFETDLMEAARRVDQQLANQSAAEAEIMAQYYDLLANVALYSEAGYGVAINYFTRHKNQVEHIFKQINNLYIDTYKSKGQFNTQEFFALRKRYFQQLDNVLKNMVGRVSMGLDINRNNIKLSLGLSTKSLLHQLKNHPLPTSDLNTVDLSLSL